MQQNSLASLWTMAEMLKQEIATEGAFSDKTSVLILAVDLFGK